MILHRFIKVHTLENRCIKACEQFTGHNHKLKWRKRITELIKKFLFFIACPLICLVVIRLIACRMHHDSCLVVCTKKSIKGFLVLNTALTIVDNYLSLHACWFNILTEVINDIFTYVVDTLISSKECFYTRPANEFILILFADMVGKRIKLFLKLGFIHVHFNRDSLEVQFKCSTVGH